MSLRLVQNIQNRVPRAYLYIRPSPEKARQMTSRLIYIIALAIVMVGCASTNKIHSEDPRFAKASKCAANIGLLIISDVTLQVRTKNAARFGDLPPGLKEIVNLEAKKHPATEYIKVVGNDIGNAGFSNAMDKEMRAMADVVANAKRKNGNDLVLILQDLIPLFEANAQSACTESGYFFPKLKRASENQLGGTTESQPTNGDIQPAAPTDPIRATAPTSTLIPSIPNPLQESVVREDVVRREQEAKRQREQVDADRRTETAITEAAAAAKKKDARALIRSASPQERKRESKPLSTPRSNYDGDSPCPCSSGRVCIGPRGGRYCITYGGNKRYGL